MNQSNGDNDIVLLSRYVEGGKDGRDKLRSFASRFLNWIYQITLSKEIKDYTSGMFVMKRNVLLMAIPNCFGHGEFFVEFVYNEDADNPFVPQFTDESPPTPGIPFTGRNVGGFIISFGLLLMGLGAFILRRAY